MTTPATLLVPVRVLLRTKTIFDGAQLFDESAIDGTLHRAAEHAASNLILDSVEVCASQEAWERSGTQLVNDELPRMTVGQLRSCFGGFLKVYVSSCADTEDAPTSLPSATRELMETQQRQQRALPTPPDGLRYDFRLQKTLCERTGAVCYVLIS